MLRPEDLRTLLQAPAETLILDFKERFEWSDTAHKFELCRDIAAFANRAGGQLIAGVAEDRGAGGFRLVGVAADDPLPDPTELNQVLRDRFDPAISCEVAYVDVDGTRYGVIQVPEFATFPHVCSREAGVSGSPPILRPGDIYVRTDTLSTQRAGPADMRRIIESAVGKTGAAIAQLVGRHVDEAGAARAPVEEPREIFQRHPTRRSLRLTPLTTPAPLRLGRIEELLAEARVTERGYSLVPRYLDPGTVDEALTVREPGRVVIELERTFSGSTTMSVVEATRDLHVNLWESLWEDSSPVLGGDKVDVTSVFRFAYAGLLFARRLYANGDVPRFRYGVGLTAPLGRALTIDHSRFTPLFRTYRATSASDLWVTREIQLAEVATQDDRATLTSDVISELLDYWGLHLNDEAIAAQLRNAREGLDDDPDPTA